jgi:hypothetical protein
MKHLNEFETWARAAFTGCVFSYADITYMKDSFAEGWRQGEKHSQALDFVIQYLYSEHQICDPEDDAAPYTPEELKEMAIKLLAKR